MRNKQIRQMENVAKICKSGGEKKKNVKKTRWGGGTTV